MGLLNVLVLEVGLRGRGYVRRARRQTHILYGWVSDMEVGSLLRTSLRLLEGVVIASYLILRTYASVVFALVEYYCCLI